MLTSRFSFFFVSAVLPWDHQEKIGLPSCRGTCWSNSNKRDGEISSLNHGDL